MSLADDLREFRRRMTEFNEWEAQREPEPLREPAVVLADISAFWRRLPPEVRLEDPDPEKRGVASLKAALAHVR